MNAKKINYSAHLNNTANHNNTVVFCIKDGYHIGDELTVNSNLNYTWNNTEKALLVSTSQDQSVLNLISLLSIKGNGAEDRFIDVSMVTPDGDTVNLAELNINPNTINTNNLDNKLQSSIENIEQKNTSNNQQNLNAVNNSDYLSYLSNNSFTIEEDDSLNFLPQATEENLPIQINKIQDNSAGDLYKVIKDSFKNTDKLEIWGYNLQADKLDLQDFANEVKGMFDYSVQNGDLEISLHTNEKDYSIVFKDVDTDKFADSLDEALASIIINNVKI